MNRDIRAWQLLAFLFICLFIIYPDIFLGYKTFVFRDFGLYGYPVAHFFRETFNRCEVPLWIPLSATGMPFLAQWSPHVLYPGSLFYLLFPLSWALGVFCILHLILAGWGMYCLAWRWTRCGLSSSLAGLVFALNGFTMNCLMWPNYMIVLAWMPWIILSADLAYYRGGRYVVWTALLLGLQFMGGTPELILFTWIAVGILWLHGLLVEKKLSCGSWIRGGMVFALATALVLGQALPFWEFVRLCERSKDFADGNWAMPGTGWANFLVPLFNCSQNPQGICFQLDQHMTCSYYMGAGVFVLALMAPLFARSSRVYLLAGILFASMIMALGYNSFLYGWVRTAIPQLGLVRFPIKFLVPAIFVIPLLAAQILAKWSRDRAGGLNPAGPLLIGNLIALVAISGIVWMGLSSPQPGATTSLLVPNALARSLFLGLMVGSLLLVWRWRQSRLAVVSIWAFLAIVAADLLAHMPRQYPKVPRWIYEPNYFREQAFTNGTPQRIMVGTGPGGTNLNFSWLPDPIANYLRFRATMYDNCNLLDNLPKLGGFYSIYLRDSWEAIHSLYEQPDAFQLRLVDFLGVTHVSDPKEPTQWQYRTTSFPLVTCGQEPVVEARHQILRNIVQPEFNPTKVVYLETSNSNLVGVADRAPSSKLLSLRWQNHNVRFQYETQTPTMAVIAQAFHPAWQAQVDGQQTPLLRANFAFQAILIPSGQHEVTLTYRDHAFLWGIGVSLLTLSGCMIYLSKHLMA